MRGVSRIVVAVAALILVLAVGGCGSTSSTDVSGVVKRVGSAYDGVASAGPFNRPMSVGQVVTVPNKADVTLQGMSLDTLGWPAPEAGKRFFVLDLTLVNRSDADLDLRPQAQLQVVDQANNQYSSLAVKGFDLLQTGQRTLAPGASARGQVAFAVPTDAKGLGLTWAPIAPAVLIIEGIDSGGMMLPSP
jgi:Domain of unknown function (DUF4352)